MVEFKGIAHINLTVRDFDKSLPFYKSLFAFLGMQEMFALDGYYYCVGKRCAIGVQSASPERAGEPFDQGRAGLHHFCLSLGSREDIDALEAHAKSLDAPIIRPAGPNDYWFPGMYSVLFADPDGIRIEANHIARPGA